MTTTDIRTRVEQVLTGDFGIAADEIAFDRTYQDLDLDSLIVLELALALQSDLDVHVTEEEIGGTETLDGLVALIGSKTEGGA